MTFQKFKQHAIKEVTSSPSAALDADVLLQHFTNKDKTYYSSIENNPVLYFTGQFDKNPDGTTTDIETDALILAAWAGAAFRC